MDFDHSDTFNCDPVHDGLFDFDYYENTAFPDVFDKTRLLQHYRKS